MKVYYGKNFWYSGQEGTPLKKIPVHDPAADGLLAWENRRLCIPAVYVGEEGAVLDLCVRVPVPDISAYMDKWKDLDYENLSGEELEEAVRESPFGSDFDIRLSLDGIPVKGRFGCSTCWNPLQPEAEPDKETEELMAEYGCSRDYGWLFLRTSCEWEDSPVLSPKKLECVLSARKRPVTAAHFATDEREESDTEKRVELTHLITGDTYTLTVRSCETGQHDGNWGDRDDDWEYPSWYQALTYTVEPELPIEDLTVQDCATGGRPRRKEKEHKEDGEGSSLCAVSVAVVPSYPQDEGDGLKIRAACSSLYFEPVDKVEWRAVFHVKEKKELCVTAKLG